MEFKISLLNPEGTSKYAVLRALAKFDVFVGKGKHPKNSYSRPAQHACTELHQLCGWVMGVLCFVFTNVNQLQVKSIN